MKTITYIADYHDDLFFRLKHRSWSFIKSSTDFPKKHFGDKNYFLKMTNRELRRYVLEQLEICLDDEFKDERLKVKPINRNKIK